MSLSRKSTIWILGLWLCASTARAQDVVEIDKIVIQKPTPTLTLPQTSGQIQFNPTLPAPSSLSQSLSRLAGLNLTQYGGLTDTVALSIRGANSRHLQIFWDGIPLATASGQGLALHNIPAGQIQKVEIYKSQTPLELGGTSPSGTLALTTKPIPPGPHATADLTLASFGTRAAGVQTSYGGTRHHWALGLDFLRTDGNFSFFDDNGTPKNPNDDQTSVRQNNFSEGGHLHGEWDFAPNPRSRFTWLAHVFSTHKGVPGLENYQSESANLKQNEILSTLKWQTTPDFSTKKNLQNQFYTRWILTKFSDPNGEIGLGQAQKNHDTTFVLGDKMFWDQNLSPHWNLTSLVHYTYESFLPKDELNADVAGSVSRRHQIQAGFAPALTTWHDSLVVSAQLQPVVAFYQINDNDPSRTSAGTFASDKAEIDWAATLSAKKQIGASTVFKAALAREVRLPQFVEMFGDQGFVLGNPELEEEHALKGEIGFVWQKPGRANVRFETTAFGEWATDLIEFELRNGVAQASNIGTTRVLGFENFLHAEPFPFLAANASYTFLDARDQDNDRFLIGRPRHNLHLTLNAFVQNFSATSDWGFTDQKYLDSLNSKSVRRRLQWDLELAYKIRKNETVSLEAKNLTDSQIEDAIGFPLPGRSFFLKWQKQW